jgi:hypothetical protein
MTKCPYRNLNTQLAVHMTDVVGNAHMLAFGVLSEVERHMAFRDLERGLREINKAFGAVSQHMEMMEVSRVEDGLPPLRVIEVTDANTEPF